jgi:hypothetical protein
MNPLGHPEGERLLPDRGLEHHQEFRIMTCALALSRRFITGMSPELVFIASFAVFIASFAV